jgi:hypothetical protein
LEGVPVITERPLVLFLPPESAEPAEVLADVRDMDVLVPYIGDVRTGPFLPENICNRQDPKYIPNDIRPLYP